MIQTLSMINNTNEWKTKKWRGVRSEAGEGERELEGSSLSFNYAESPTESGKSPLPSAAVCGTEGAVAVRDHDTTDGLIPAQCVYIASIESQQVL